jgi:hypothetical protein
MVPELPVGPVNGYGAMAGRFAPPSLQPQCRDQYFPCIWTTSRAPGW